MSDGTLLARLHGSAIRVQVPLVLAAVPLAVGLYGAAVAPIVLDVVLADAPQHTRAVARDAATLVVGILVGCVLVVTGGAALLLRGSMRAVIERMQEATAAIAGGDFTHRIDSARSDELGALARSIDTMAQRLERLEQARRRLLACVSHELRTPLTIIRGHAFTLARHEQDVLRRDRLDMIEAEAGRLGSLIEDLVDASSLHAGSVRLRVERCDLLDVLASTIARFAEEAALRDQRIELRGAHRELPVDVDPIRLEQLLANLLANAVRHAHAGTTIEVTVSARRGAAARYVTVANRGPAIPAELAPTIFEPFVQGEEHHGRVGLGLAIAHGLAAAHGGSLTLASSGQLSGVVEFQLLLPPPARVEPRAAGHAQRRALAEPPVPRLRAVESS